MNFDELKICTRCGSNACYSQEVTKDIIIEFCYGCGFQSNSVIKQGSQFLQEQMEVLPELYKELLDEEEETGKIWMPSTVNVEDKGMVFADGSGRMNWKWAGVKVIPIEDDSDDKFKNKKYKPDMSTLKHFDEGDFMDALSYIEVLP
tara:strand:+ start:2509 stop:2949 length:441 start_codon:yes stop_codon:yes gene_type:complete